MAVKNINANLNLMFDEQKETDICYYVDYLIKTNTCGKVVSDLLRTAFNNPNILQVRASGITNGDELRQYENGAIGAYRSQYFNSVESRLKELENKVDKIYNMALSTYTLAEFGKRIGIKDKSTNLATAQFQINKQLKDLEQILGYSLGQTQEQSSSLEKQSESILEYIINSYDNIVSELKSQTVEVRNTAETNQTLENKEAINIGNKKDSNKIVNITERISEEPAGEVQEESIDFSDADMGALENFFGI